MIYEMNEDDFRQGLHDAPIRVTPKRQFGEVMTPYAIVEHVLDRFPPSIWTHPEYTWMDPSAGSGLFMVGVYFRLMRHLSDTFTKKRARHNHIVRHMLYMRDLQAIHARQCKKLFGTDANVYQCDFLDTSTTDTPFSCIVGNPPFQESGIGRGGKSKLYERFCIHSLAQLAPNGWLSFICPIGLFGGAGTSEGKDNTYTQIVSECTVPFLSFSNLFKDEFVGIQQPMCAFLARKRHAVTTSATTIEQADGTRFKVKLSPTRAVNPVGHWTPRTESLTNRFIGSRNTAIYNRGYPLSRYNQTARGKYTLLYTPTQQLFTGDIHLARGVGVKKVVIYGIGAGDPVISVDWRGEFGVGPVTFYFPFVTRAEGQRLVAFFTSPDFIELSYAVRTQRQFIKTAFLEHVRLPTHS